MSESISRSNRGSRNRSMDGRAEENRKKQRELSANDTDVKIASKAVAIKSNTRVRPKKLVREGDLAEKAGDK